MCDEERENKKKKNAALFSFIFFSFSLIFSFYIWFFILFYFLHVLCVQQKRYDRKERDPRKSAEKVLCGGRVRSMSGCMRMDIAEEEEKEAKLCRGFSHLIFKNWIILGCSRCLSVFSP